MNLSPNLRLAGALEDLRRLQQKSSVVHSAELALSKRQVLLDQGFLQPINRDWFAISHPHQSSGDTTLWASCFWDFCQRYMDERFGDKWCLSPLDSARIVTGSSSIPRNIVCLATQGNNQNVKVLNEASSIFVQKKDIDSHLQYTKVSARGLRHWSCEYVLSKLSAQDMRQDNVTTAVLLQKASLDNLAQVVIETANRTVASRLLGAYRAMGRKEDEDRLRSLWNGTFHKLHADNPFEESPPEINRALRHPVSARLDVLWQSLRPVVEGLAPPLPAVRPHSGEVLASIDDAYTQDAYHSLSIEGYKVTEALIERVRSGQWNPEDELSDANARNAMAARGYYDAFQQVRADVARVLQGEVSDTDMLIKGYRPWKEKLFGPGVQAGLVKQGDVAGFRRHPVFLKGSRHVPVAYDALSDAMETFDYLVKKEPDPFVRSVLGHLFLGYIHPFFDGNGRTARLFMNASLSVAGYPWVITKVEDRREYLDCLEKASVEQDIKPFALFVANQITMALSPNPAAPSRRKMTN